MIQPEQLFRLMLRVYPRSFQARFGEEMWLVFHDCLREVQHQRLATLRLWLHTLIDISMTALQEHRRQRIMDTTAFDRQLASSLDLWIAALRRGYSLKQIMEMIAQHAPEPTASAFQNSLQELQNGLPMDRVLANLADRVASDHWQLVQATFIQQFSEGGNLADRLEPVRAQISTARPDAENWSEEIKGNLEE